MTPTARAGLVAGGIVLGLLLVVGAVALVAGGGGGDTPPREKGGLTGRAAPAADKVDFAVTAQELYTAYATNAANAQQVYGGKLLEIRGTVAESGKDAAGQYVTFSVSPPPPPAKPSNDPAAAWDRAAAASASMGSKRVRCYLDSPATFKVNAEATLRGRCAGMPSDVVLKECHRPPGR